MNAYTLVSVPKQSLGKGLGFPLGSEPFTTSLSSILKILPLHSHCMSDEYEEKKERIVTVFIIAYNLPL